MNSNKETGRIVGILLLLTFIMGVSIYQFLRGPIVFAEDYLTITSLNSNQIITSILLGFLSGTISIVIAVILLPVFKAYSDRLAYLYVAFCILNFMALTLENYGALSLMELSNEFVINGAGNNDFFQHMGAVFYENHKWTHYIYLLISCLPVFVLYYTLFYSKLIPRVISIFGLIAVLLMFIEVVISIYGVSTNMNLMIPMGLIQLFLPFWLIIKGLKNNTINHV